MRKIFLLITFFTLSIFSFSQDIVGEWNFDYILADSTEIGENLKPISEGDFMQINKDGSFNYTLAAIPLQASGSWDLSGNTLTLNYKTPSDTTRFYNITLLRNALTLNENGINFSFQREVVAPIATSGFSISSLLRGILGIISLLLIAFLFSRNRKGIDWALAAKGLGIQILFAILILKAPLVSSGFEFVGKIFTKIISFTQDGTMFLFSSFETGLIEAPLVNFVVMILPTVIFFSALTSLFYY